MRRRRRQDFEVVAEEGWNSANKRVLRKMLESETETSSPDMRTKTRITPDNYEFAMAGDAVVEGRPAYAIDVFPKRSDKYLFKGRIWVDAQDSRCYARKESRRETPPSGPGISISFNSIERTVPSGSRHPLRVSLKRESSARQT